jgi:ribose transport system permease protein
MALDATADALPTSAARKRRSREQQFVLMGSRIWSWIFLAILVAYFAWQGTGFFTLNSQNILVNIVSIMLMGLGQTFVIIAGGIDLSVGWTMGLSSVISAKTTRSPPRGSARIAIAPVWAGLGVALVSGLISGSIVAKLRSAVHRHPGCRLWRAGSAFCWPKAISSAGNR